jgi:hypothetical protein
MNIYEEYQRLCSFAESEEKWKEIERLWLIASGYIFIDGEWYAEGNSEGKNITSFAIHLPTYEYLLGERGFDHKKTRLDLIALIARKRESYFDLIEDEIVEGRMAHVNEWNYPLVVFGGVWIFENKELLSNLEKKVLEFGIGLPVTSFKLKYLHVA